MRLLQAWGGGGRDESFVVGGDGVCVCVEGGCTQTVATVYISQCTQRTCHLIYIEPRGPSLSVVLTVVHTTVWRLTCTNTCPADSEPIMFIIGVNLRCVVYL